MTDELTDAAIDAIEKRECDGDTTSQDVLALVAALRSERTQNAELVRLLEIEEGTSWMLATDRDDSLIEAEELRAELERERTQTLALRHSVPSLVREVRLSGAARSKPFTEALEEVERAWAALSTQEESK